MAIITCRAVVRISGNPLVLIVHLGLITVLMAIDATEYLVIIRVSMAVSAKRPGTGVMPGINRKILTIMIEGGGYPCNCVMARLAIGGKLR